MGIQLVLEMAAQATPDQIAVGAEDDGMTYAELQRRAAIGAQAVLDSGADHLAYLGGSTLALPVALFASAIAGVPFVPINYRLGDEQLEFVLGNLDHPLILADARSAERLKGSDRTIDRDAWLESTREGEAAVSLTSDEAIAMLLYTSGTTGTPKAAILRHYHLLAYLFGSLELATAGLDDAALVCVPPYHIAGVSNVLSNVYSCRRIVYLDSFTPEGWLETARTERVSQALLVPTMLARIVDSLEAAGRTEAGLPGLRSIAYGGAPMPASVLERALALFPESGFVNAYGLTETCSTIAMLDPDDHRRAAASEAPAVRARLQSVGTPLPGIEIEIRGEDGGKLAPGKSGLLWVRGDQVAGEYVGEQAIDRQGWFPTRDRAFQDEEGYLFIEGRADDTIIRGGENIAAAEIENVLTGHPAVREAAVVGLPDPEWGQRIGAAVVLRRGRTATEEELREWVRSRLRSSKTPTEIVLRESLPHTDTGKLLRRQVLADMEESQSHPTSSTSPQA